ncbi:exo-alpha-sialidase, partial [Trueperella bernardiae]|uniref:exo-alpha-sialidase n=3 Tax=Trueperella bernardiae TaxID=59561 RepID=UPI000AE55C6C
MKKAGAWRRKWTLAATAIGALALTPLAPLTPVAVADSGAPADTHISYYSFDESATKDQWGSRDGTPTGDLPLVEGKVGKAVEIKDGAKITYPELNLPHDWSIGFWVKAPTATGRASIIQSADGVRAVSQRLAENREDKIGFHVLPGAGGVLTYNYTLANNTWTHITATNSSTKGIALYVNGSLLELKSWGITNPVAAPLDILGGEGFTGVVDELKIYNRALTADEVRAEIDGLEPEPEPQVPTLKATFAVTNPNPDGAPFQVGDVIRYTINVTNDTGKTRSFEATDSNLDNWSGCKWNTFEAGATKACPFPTYTVTAEDVERGSFTPSITFQYYENTGYSGATTPFAPFTGEPTEVVAKLAEVTSFEFTAGTGKGNYQVGDELTATLTVENPTDADISISAGDCQATIAPGQSHSCELPYAVTDDDLERGEAQADVVVNATQGDRTSVETARATTPTPTIRPAATAFTPPNADPRLEANLTDLQILESNTSAYNIRIPAIAVASNGDILASYDLRPTNGAWNGGDSPNENSIVQRRSTDGGKTWGPMTVIAEGKVAPAGERYGWSDPSYVVDYTTGEIFNFHVGSLDAGLPNGPGYRVDENGNVDETYRKTMNFALTSSTDNGYTWSSRIITNEVLGARAAQLDGCFATSGAGIQKMHEPYKGRLLQQAACRVKGSTFQAITIYSDDHGKTWHGGEFASATEGAPTNGRWQYDENKIVELSDGRLMLNSRVSGGTASGYRIVATSDDGGVTWQDIHVDKNLVDATNNAQIIRAFPTAEKGTLRSKVLLFSNTESGRTNGTVKMSYDDGTTWPISRQVRQGGTGYTTMAVQPDGSIGLLMEPDVFNKIGYVNFTLKYLTKKLPFELELNQVRNVKATDGTQIAPIQLKTTGNDPALADTFTAEGLPAGLEIDAATGVISGTPAVDNAAQEAFEVTVTVTEADDGTGIPRTSSKTFTITVSPKVVEPEPGPDPEPEPNPEPGPGPVQCDVMDRPAAPSRATGVLGDATGDKLADLWSVDESGAIHFYAND